MALHKWRLEDPSDPDPLTNTWTFEINPKEMTSPFRGRNIVGQGSVAVGGQTLVWEGNPGPADWEFRGRIFTKTMFDKLLEWSKRQNRFYLYDHFGRKLTVIFTRFDPIPRTQMHHYWNHDYSMTAIVFDISTATVGEVWS
jgi:hypothetical protein